MISMLELMAGSAGSAAAAPLYVDDVFFTTTRTGTGASVATTVAPDLSTNGGTIWTKGRSGATSHKITDTGRGVQKGLCSDTTAAQTTDTNGVTAIGTTSYTIGSDSNYNTNGETYVDWGFREAAKFHKKTTKAHTNGVADTVDLSSLGTVGFVLVKGTIAGGDNWLALHRSNTSGKLCYLNLTSAETTDASISLSGTTLTLASSLATDTYVIYVWAHDTSATSIIQCVPYTTDGSGNATVVLGFEPQALITRSSASGYWYMLDSARGFTVTAAANKYLNPNVPDAEGSGVTWAPNATGFSVAGLGATSTLFFAIAIRRSNKPPTAGTQVYNAIARTGTSAVANVTGVGFAPDNAISSARTAGYDKAIASRLIGAGKEAYTSRTVLEQSYSDTLTSFNMDGITLGADATDAPWNRSPDTYIEHFLKRAAGFYDQICYGGTGANKTEAHNLTVAPELWRAKRRDATGNWVYGSSLLANTEKIIMPSPNGKVTDATAWNSTFPTASVISLGTLADVNAAGGTYELEMWATLAGVSKIGIYTGDGSAQNIDCGFAAGARYIEIMRTTASTAQDIFIFDTVRGIVSGNDPRLSLNTTAAEVTTDDSIDPYNAGFTVNQLSATNINVNGAIYLFRAIS